MTVSVSPVASSTPLPVFTHTSTNEPLKAKLGNTRDVWPTSSDEPVCRICHDSENGRGQTKLISPCACTGSAQFTHQKCLRKWTTVKGATTCEICNQDYKPKYMRFRQKLMTRQVLCMGSAASLPLLVVIIVGFFLLGEQLSVGNSDEDIAEYEEKNPGRLSTSKIMISVCMIGTATFGISLLCCFSVWAAKAQPQQIQSVGRGEHDVEQGGQNGHNPRSAQNVPMPLFFF